MHVQRQPDAVRWVFHHESMRGELWDDGVPKPLPVAATIYHLAVKETIFSEGASDDVLIGAVMMVPMGLVIWNPHIAILPQYQGKGTEAMRLAMLWMFENTPCRKLVAYPPAFNTRMIRVFEKCRFEREGFSPLSYLWHGKLEGRVLMGASP